MRFTWNACFYKAWFVGAHSQFTTASFTATFQECLAFWAVQGYHIWNRSLCQTVRLPALQLSGKTNYFPGSIGLANQARHGVTTLYEHNAQSDKRWNPPKETLRRQIASMTKIIHTTLHITVRNNLMLVTMFLQAEYVKMMLNHIFSTKRKILQGCQLQKSVYLSH